MIRKLPPLEYLKECFRYDRRTGLLFWKKRPLKHFSDRKSQRWWNSNFAGMEALGSICTSGHKRGFLDGKSCAAHRVVWKLVTGKEPPDVIDHIDRDPINNRWGNLREATNSQNFINRTRGWGISGHPGLRVGYGGRWEARIHKDKKYIHIGTFASKTEALAARKRVEKELYGAFSP